jgi:hypothetical protein
MAICVHFVPVSMNAGQYQQAVKLIAEAGQGAPAGRLYHVASGTRWSGAGGQAGT